MISEFREPERYRGSSNPPGGGVWWLVNGLWALVIGLGMVSSSLTVVKARKWRWGVGGCCAVLPMTGMWIRNSGTGNAVRSSCTDVRPDSVQ